MFPTPGRGKHWAGFTFTWPESPAGSTITLDQVKPDERVFIDDTEKWIDLTPRGKAQWIRFHHHPIAHVRIQVDPILHPTGSLVKNLPVAGSKEPSPRVRFLAPYPSHAIGIQRGIATCNRYPLHQCLCHQQKVCVSRRIVMTCREENPQVGRPNPHRA